MMIFCRWPRCAVDVEPELTTEENVSSQTVYVDVLQTYTQESTLGNHH